MRVNWMKVSEAIIQMQEAEHTIQYMTRPWSSIDPENPIYIRLTRILDLIKLIVRNASHLSSHATPTLRDKERIRLIVQAYQLFRQCSFNAQTFVYPNGFTGATSARRHCYRLSRMITKSARVFIDIFVSDELLK